MFLIVQKGRNILSSPDHLKKFATNDTREDSNDDIDANSTQSPLQIKNAVSGQ